MKLRRQSSFHAEVATSSLNDIMFFLLLFFLIISTVASPNAIKILLPKSDPTPSLTRKPITLTITSDKKYYVNRESVSYSQLEVALLEASKEMTDPTVVVRIPYSSTVQDLVDVMKIGTKNKLKMVLATEKL